MLIDVLSALVVVVSVGLLLGVLLALVIHFFGIEEDERCKKIREALPGINCGACGYKGCNDYAEAIAKGTAKPNLCIPGAETTAKELGEILGVAVEEPKDMVVFVHCNGTCDAALDKAVYEGIDSCKATSMLYGGPKACRFGCTGCGDCAKVCVSNAICMKNGIAVVDTSRCIGCGVCMQTCPKKLISMIPQETESVIYCNNKDKGAEARKSCKNACIGCGKCMKVCPSGAISLQDNCGVISYDKCNGCGACAEACPTACLKMVHFPDIPEGFEWK